MDCPSAQKAIHKQNILTSRYGKVSKFVNAHVQMIIALPIIHGSKPTRIYEFYEKVLTHVQSLETMGKLNTTEGYVRNTLDKLHKFYQTWPDLMVSGSNGTSPNW